MLTVLVALNSLSFAWPNLAQVLAAKQKALYLNLEYFDIQKSL